MADKEEDPEASAPAQPPAEAETERAPAATSPAARSRDSSAGAPRDAPIEVDNTFNDNDSAFDDSASIYTTSLASSVENYPIEHGRRYHAYRAGRYSRPNDEMEMDRLLLIHDIVTRVTDGLYQAPIDKDKTKLILDIGTGTGIWAISIGDEFPEATVIGNDLSANMPTFVPPNVKFEVDDVESEWLYDKKFDWIFCRYMAASIFEWPKLVNNIYDNIEPGGWVEFQDFDLQYYSDDGSLKPDDPLLFWISTLLDAARQLKRDPNPGSKLEGWAKDAGFQNIVHKKYKIPIGPWPKDPVLKEAGMMNYMQITGGLEGLSMRLYTNVLKWKVEEIMVLLAKVRKDLKNPSIHALMDFHVVYGQKPE